MNTMRPRRTPMERLRQSGAEPDRSLGQNFLVDPNILDVIERAAALASRDVVLEVGPGVGVLTERLIDRCSRVYAIELDPTLLPLLEEEFAGESGLTVFQADAMQFDFKSLVPPPTKFVANLPYNIAAPLVMRSLDMLPSLELWCLMLQKEIANRLFASPGSRDYTGISVMTQLLTEKLSSRPVSGSVFYPRPRVRSSLLVFSRRIAIKRNEFARIQSVVHAAFSHRRKTLANSMSEAPVIPEPLVPLELAQRKEMLSSLLERLGLSAASRAQALSPEKYQELTIRLWEGQADGGE
jgi:16S rRNA (adenine1518-N6/adenine1519-N6)-dimethyltransferase